MWIKGLLVDKHSDLQRKSFAWLRMPSQKLFGDQLGYVTCNIDPPLYLLKRFILFKWMRLLPPGLICFVSMSVVEVLTCIYMYMTYPSIFSACLIAGHWTSTYAASTPAESSDTASHAATGHHVQQPVGKATTTRTTFEYWAPCGVILVH